MSVYIDRWGGASARATVNVQDDTKSAKVTYRNDSGKKFSVMVHQKPNPIGFSAKLPGDKPAK